MIIENISEALVLAEASDLPALAKIHTQFQTVAEELAREGKELAAKAALSCADIITGIILEQENNPTSAMELISKTVSCLQAVILDGRPEDQIEFPNALLQNAGGCAAENEDKRPYIRPAHIDEALIEEFLAKQISALDEIESSMLAIESENLTSAPAELKRLLHTLKGESGLLNLPDVERLCHETETCLDAETLPSVDSLLNVKDWLGRAFKGIEQGICISGAEEVIEQLRSGKATDFEKEPIEAEQSSVGDDSVEGQTTDEAEETLAVSPLDADTALMGEFVIEAREHLEEADLKLLALEMSPDDSDALNAVFRSFHTIKGTSAFLNLEDISKLAHEAENLLNLARSGELVFKGRAVDVSLEAVDLLRGLLDSVEEAINNEDTSLAANPVVPDLIRRIKAASCENDPDASTDSRQISSDPMPKLGEVMIESGRASTEKIVDALVDQKTTMQGSKLGEILVKTGRAGAKDVIHALREQRTGTQPTPQEDRPPKLGEIMVADGTITPDDVAESLAEQRSVQKDKKIGELLVSKGRASNEDVSRALRTQNSSRAGSSISSIKEVVKVDAVRLDSLVDTIGELVIAEAMVCQSMDTGERASADLTRSLSQLNKITRELQSMGMTLRMIPVKSTFQKMARLVRDLARKAGKEVDLALSGEDTELDKSVVDRIGDPLVHMVRNAVDHGIESDVQERRQKGKPDKAKIELRAFHKGGNIYIEIEDDGRGLDSEAILKKGIERGLVEEGEALGEREIFNLIFEPGFSTAKQITDVSGRGVGMDVVKRNITDLRGSVEITSIRGKGSIFSIRLPLTLAIIDGMLVRVGAERYIIPTLSVIGAVKPESDNVNTVLKQGRMLSFQNELIPLFPLENLLGIANAQRGADQGIVILVEDGGRKAGLIVDELLGLRQTVIKNMGELIGKVAGLSGATILSDGRVGLILDVNGAMELIDQNEVIADSCLPMAPVAGLCQEAG
ncbi:MAG: chemotaxis protein CheA, partial [Candidatus Coatesbacteria bacterium]|nr:chemotaxis protein CheA [Candidatus Coatesbacteria bacterium]